MTTQNQIKRVLSKPENIAYIRGLLKGKEISSRAELARRVCKDLGFEDARGKPQIGSCLKGLRELESLGHFSLPAALNTTGPKKPRRLGEPVAEPRDVPDQASAVEGLSLILVTTEEQMRIWNELMLQEHPLGAGPLVGRQLRYLIGSAYGWLGGIGYGASALQLSARDEWIGWTAEQRREYLHSIVGMSRFLIRSSVRCENLASKVLSMSMRVMPEDFERTYNYRPWLVESFVDTSQYDGACYKAANWILLGQTRGRGRQDRYTQAALSKKDIYVYVLNRDFRTDLGLAENAGMSALTPDSGIESPQWAAHEFGEAPLGDKRLSARLVQVAGMKADVPDRAFSGVSKGDWATTKAYYRLIDHPDEAAVNMENILLPHRQRTVRRMQGQKTVLCIQDGTDVVYTNLEKCTGLGTLGKNQTGAKSYGLHLHSSFVVAPNGIPLGVLKADCQARAEKEPQECRPTYAIPIEEKKSFAWIAHHRDMVAVAGSMPNTRVINVCDREADFFELFDEQRKNPRVELLIRAKSDRNIVEESTSLFETVREEKKQHELQIPVPRQSARAKKSKQKARKGRAARLATMAIRYKQIQIKPAAYHAEKDPITLWVIHAVEENPPPHNEAVEWYLLTTIPITKPEDAEECLRWYCLRWRIEDWHRVLKSGCRIEDLAHETAERLRRAIAINLVIAWRIMLMTLLGRETPDLPSEILFSDVELRTLRAYAKKRRLEIPDTLGKAVRLIAMIGGYLNRAKDPPPGHQILWQGFREFQFMCLGFSLLDDV